jgi:tetratricopeptide (TPR) repeat protein
MFAITFNLGDENKAATYLDDNIKLLERYKYHPRIGCAIAANFVYRYLYENDLEQAKFYYTKAEKLCNSSYLKDALEYLKAEILGRDKCYDEAREVIERLKQNKLTPSMKNKIMKIEEVVENQI